ncbi:integrase catalytic region [Rhodovulum sulfidophilum]|uniref:Integrase catalytic region n=2 Tax=Rhodovulum sulfidophilum TaxID=35806 RepID=A0A0D6AYE8_RHOSU|nr:integrase catalytic region [Rhodovulum sulfidophilum]
MTPSQIKGWRLELAAAGSAEAIRRQQVEAAELAELRRENRRLKEEVEVMRKASAFFAQWAAMNAKLEFIAAHAAGHAVSLMCRVLSVSTSWFYSWRAAAPKRAERRAAREELLPRIRAIFEASHRRYGAPRIHAELRDQGIRIARKTVAKLMKGHDIRPPRRGRRVPRTIDSRHIFGIAPNLLRRNFRASEPDRIWLADISYVPTDEGWLYLAAVKDMATMEIVGWSMSARLKSSLAVDAMRMALQNRRPAPELICHSDRGIQYAAGDYRLLLKAWKAAASMSRKGDCLDNAPMESFFGSLKNELVHRTRFRSRRDAKAALFEYIAIFYNRQRRHSSIGYRTPEQARSDMTAAMAA